MIVRCRICFDEENINESQQEEELRKNNFVSPCNCAGSNKYVHAKCLDQWRKQNVNNFMKCPTCAGIYNIFFQKGISDAILFPLLYSSLTVFISTFLICNFRLLWLGNMIKHAQYYLNNERITYNFWKLRRIGYVYNGYLEMGNNIKNNFLYLFMLFCIYLPHEWKIGIYISDLFIFYFNWRFYFKTGSNSAFLEFNKNIFPKISNFYLYDK